MPFQRLTVIAALLILPTIASAQRGSMGGTKDADWNAVAGKSAPAGPTISSKDFENVSPLKLLLDKKKDLKLSDAQVTSLQAADASLKQKNHERFVLLDSLKKDAKPRTSGTPSAEDEARLVIARESLRSLVSDVQVTYDEAAKSALPMLDESQKPAGEKLLQKYTENMQEMLRDKMGGRPPSAVGGGRGRGRGGFSI